MKARFGVEMLSRHKNIRLEGKDEHGKFVRDTQNSDLMRAEGREEIRLARENRPNKGSL